MVSALEKSTAVIPARTPILRNRSAYRSTGKKEGRSLYQDDANSYGARPGFMLIAAFGSGIATMIHNLLGNPRAKKTFDDGRLLGLEFEVDDTLTRTT